MEQNLESIKSVDNILKKYSDIPDEYIKWLSEVGYGELQNGYMLYSGPLESKEIFGKERAGNYKNIILIADDFSGYHVGFMKRDEEWKLVGIESLNMEIEFLGVSFLEFALSKYSFGEYRC